MIRYVYLTPATSLARYRGTETERVNKRRALIKDQGQACVGEGKCVDVQKGETRRMAKKDSLGAEGTRMAIGIEETRRDETKERGRRTRSAAAYPIDVLRHYGKTTIRVACCGSYGQSEC